MKRSVLLLFVLLIVNVICAQNKINNITIDETDGEEMLLGVCNLDGLKMEPFNTWFQEEYDNYVVDVATLKGLNQEKFEGIEIFIIMGTWCSDSQREVPRFYKILENINFTLDNILMIAVDRSKTVEDVPISRMEIELVPTIIFHKDGEELGRIIESPEESLEKDILKILSGI